jgi:hypothetical protein
MAYRCELHLIELLTNAEAEGFDLIERIPAIKTSNFQYTYVI